jgi:hypothetical protein
MTAIPSLYLNDQADCVPWVGAEDGSFLFRNRILPAAGKKNMFGTFL